MSFVFVVNSVEEITLFWISMLFYFKKNYKFSSTRVKLMLPGVYS